MEWKRYNKSQTVNQSSGTEDQSMVLTLSNTVYLVVLEGRLGCWNGFLEMMDVIVKTAKANVKCS